MSIEPQSEEFHFLQSCPDESADEFLRQRLSFMRERFSYERLSGCSKEELNNQVNYYNEILRDTYEHFGNEDSIFTADPEVYEYVSGEEADFYKPLNSDQEMQIVSVAGEIHMNFDKAWEDAKDRKYKRLNLLANSLPLLNRLQR